MPVSEVNDLKTGVNIHGVRINVTSNNPKLVAYAGEHMGGLTTEPTIKPDIEVHCEWSVGDWEPEANPFETNGQTHIYGKRMLGQNNDLIWLNTLRMKGLKLRFQREGSVLKFHVDYCYHPKKEREGLDYEYKRYFSLMSYMIYYPLFWYLENFRGWTLMHASALETEHGGVMIGGLGGIGKTTTCIALIQHANAKLISENIIFTDGQKLYPCYEPIRLNPDSIEMLSENFQGLRKMNYPEGLKDKSMYHINTESLPTSVPAKALFMPSFSPTRYVKPYDTKKCAEKMAAANRLTREIDDYYWYASALEMLWPKEGQSALRGAVMHKLAETAACYELGIDRNAGVEAVVEDIMNSIK